MSRRPFVIRATAPCRLHFGLFHVPTAGDPPGTRRFGGVGLMVRPPAVEVAVAPGDRWEHRGSLGERAVRFAERVIAARGPGYHTVGPLRVLADGPPEHVGLGVGTALGLAVAAALTADRIGRDDGPTLARLAGRGERSAVGTYGFDRGGLLVDDGRVGDEFPHLLDRVPVPDGWRVLLVRPPVPAGWYGDRERAAFARSRSPAAAYHTTRRLRELATGTLVPAVELGDFDEFAAGVAEFNRLAGEPFAADQGGVYAGPAVTAAVETLRALGAAGVGQSSWGPTVFAFARDPLEAERLRLDAVAALPDAAVRVAEPDNGGADVRFELDTDQLDRFEADWRAAQPTST